MSTSDPLIGRQLGDYKIEKLIGHGGMARVYSGYDEKLDRYAAVKVIEPTLMASGEEGEYRDRFLREARSIARLNHPNIVGVYQFAQEENLYFIAMAFLDGRDLREILKENAEERKLMPREEMVKILHDIASSLDYAHKNGIIHRDIKPSNIIITTEGHAVLTDFGLALNAVEGTIGNTFGSVHYIAPEQAISSAQAVAQSDQYSLGIIVYELLAGQVPFDDASAMSVALKHISDPPPPIRDLNSKVSPQLEAVVMRALDKEPTNRYPSAVAFIDAFEKALADAPDALLGESLANRPVHLPPASPSMDDDAPTIADSKSKSQSISSAIPSATKDVSEKSSGGGMNMTYAAIAAIVVIALILGGVFMANSAAEATAATETAVANVTGTAIIVAENETATQEAEIANGIATTTAEFIAEETANANATTTAEFIAEETANGIATTTAEFIAEETANAIATTTAEFMAEETANANATSVAQDNATSTQSFAETQTALPTLTPSATYTASATLAPSATYTSSPTATFTYTPLPTATATPTRIPLVAQEGEEQLLLRYDGRSALLTNRMPNSSVFIDSLVFTKFVLDEEGTFVESDSFRMSSFSGAPTSLRTGACIQLWDSRSFSRPADNNELATGSCDVVPTWRTSNEIFWADDTRDFYFRVTINRVDQLATCPTNRVGSLIEQRCVIQIR